MGVSKSSKGGCCCCCCACYPQNANTVIVIPGRGKQKSQVVKVPGDANVVVVRKNDDKSEKKEQQVDENQKDMPKCPPQIQEDEKC